ncbi:hypothetical protein AAFN47_24540 [Hoeflea sp. CAU 1731]
MAEDWRWFIGIMVTLALAFAGVIRNLYAKLSRNSAELHKRIADLKDPLVDIKADGQKRHDELKGLVNRALER